MLKMRMAIMTQKRMQERSYHNLSTVYTLHMKVWNNHLNYNTLENTKTLMKLYNSTVVPIIWYGGDTAAVKKPMENPHGFDLHALQHRQIWRQYGKIIHTMIQ